MRPNKHLKLTDRILKECKLRVTALALVCPQLRCEPVRLHVHLTDSGRRKGVDIGSRLGCVLAAVIFCVPIQAASAQRLAVGTYIRVSYDCQSTTLGSQTLTRCQRTKGPLAAVTPETVHVRGLDVAILRNSIQALEERTRRNRRWLGAGLGFLAGSAVGVGVAFLGASTCESSEFFDCIGWLAAIPVGSAAGIVTGVIIGGGERWQQVPLDRLGSSLAGSPPIFGVGVGVAF